MFMKVFINVLFGTYNEHVFYLKIDMIKMSGCLGIFTFAEMTKVSSQSC